MLASPTPDYQSPKRHREVCEQARKWSAVPWIIDGVFVFVDDLDAHFRRAKAAGATILSDIEDGRPADDIGQRIRGPPLVLFREGLLMSTARGCRRTRRHLT